MFKILKNLITQKILRILKNLITPIGTLEDILIKSVEENLELVLKVQKAKNVYKYIPLNNKDLSYIRCSMSEYLDKDFYYYVIERCIIFEQI